MSLQRIKTLINSKRKAILINTFEEHRFENEMIGIAEAKGYDLISWSMTEGFVDLETSQVTPMPDIEKMLKTIEKTPRDTIYILKDIHDIWNSPKSKRKIRDILEKAELSNVYTPIFFVSPVVNIPMELERLIALCDFELPTEKEIEEKVDTMVSYISEQGLSVPTDRELIAVKNALKGLTHHEITSALKESVVETKTISLDYIIKEKEQTIKKTGLLQYVTKLGNMSNVGGFDLLKQWLEDARYSFNVDTSKYMIKSAKGIILSGFPGVGKSLIPKSIAYDWNLPLLKMNMSQINNY